MTLGIAFLHMQMQARAWHIQDHPRKCFVKVSGDMFLDVAFLDWVSELARTSHVVISIGGGTQINRAFETHGFKSTKHPKLGRNATPEGYRLALKVLEENKTALERHLRSRNVIADVVLPVLSLAGVDCHVDGDLMISMAYWGFDELFVVTTSERVETKRELFRDMSKVSVISL